MRTRTIVNVCHLNGGEGLFFCHDLTSSLIALAKKLILFFSLIYVFIEIFLGRGFFGLRLIYFLFLGIIELLLY